jgi:iron complex outermembrane receptor protein
MNYKDQLILTGQINDVGGFTRKNIDKSYRTGVELELGYKLSEKLLIEANTTFSQNKINLFVEHNDLYDANYSWIGSQTIEYSKTNIALSPSLVSAGSLTYSPLNNLSLNLTGKYVGKQYIDNTSSNNRALKAYFVNDFRINYTLKPKFMKEFGLTFQINNLFNVLYETNAWVYKGVVEGKGLITLDDGFFPQAGRHFYLGTSLKF